MLELWEEGSFSGGVSSFENKRAVKLGFAELIGVDSAKESKTPDNRNKISVRRISSALFEYPGKLDGKRCRFKIDTGSDVSIISEKFVENCGNNKMENHSDLVYPTGEKVPVRSRVTVGIELGKFSFEMSMYVVKMEDDCLLGTDFLSKTDAEMGIRVALGISQLNRETVSCVQVSEDKEHVPEELQSFFSQHSRELNDSQKNDLVKFISEYKDVFSEAVTAGNCDIVRHEIELLDNRPIKQNPRRVPLKMRTEAERLVEEMWNKGIIEESHSPWLSPVVLTKKKDGSYRFCVDFRCLNARTIKDSYPLPRVDDLLDRLSGNVWFSTIDLKNGYWQVKLRDKDKEKTAFSIGKGLWQFTVMPFGLCNAPATFERMMEKILNGLLFKICLVYLDDVIVFSPTFLGMMENLRVVFARLREVNLKINPKKCVLFSKNVNFLGHIISEKGVTTDPQKISAVAEWPVPTTKKQVRSFLGFCSYYRRFVKGFSLLARPLYILTENLTKFLWTEQCQQAFDSLKQALTTPPVLSFPLENMEFVLDTDASGHGIGAVLSQVQYGTEKVIAYYSRVLSKAERNYCVTRRELLAIVDSLKSFHHYLYGQKFVIQTDHQSLKWLLSFKNLEGQLARWIERIQQYNFEIVYRKGSANKNADGLSRRPCEKDLCGYCKRVELREVSNSEEVLRRIIFGKCSIIDWRKEQLEDPSISFILLAKEQQQRPFWQTVSSNNISAKIYWSYWDLLVLKDGVLHKKWESPNLKSHIFQVIVPQNRIKEVLEEAHDSPSSGHFGVNKTLDRIRRRFYWATCKKDVENWCESCKICVAKKGPADKGKSPLQIYNVGLPMERLQMDILGPLPITFSGNKYLLVVVDCFSKWVEAFPVRNIRASTVADTFVKQFISRHGVPLELHTDQGRSFESRLFQEISKVLGIKKTRTSALHPQSDGQVERQHFTIVNYLSKFISENQRDWDQWVPMFLLAYRSSRHESTGISPAEVHQGRELRLPLDLLRGIPPSGIEMTSSYCQQFQKKLDSIHQVVRQNLFQKSMSAKIRYDRKARKCHFVEGSKVWFYNPHRKVGKAPKLQMNWEGPFEIVKKLSDVVYCIQRSKKHKKKIVHSDRLASFCERTI